MIYLAAALYVLGYVLCYSIAKTFRPKIGDLALAGYTVFWPVMVAASAVWMAIDGVRK